MEKLQEIVLRDLKRSRIRLGAISTERLEKAARFSLPAMALLCAMAGSWTVLPQFFSQDIGDRLAAHSPIDGSMQEEFDSLFGRLGANYQFFRDMAGIVRMKLFGQTRHGVVTTDTGWMFNLNDFATPDEAMRKRAVDLMVDAHADLSSHGTELVVMFAPYKAEIAGDHLNIHAITDTLRSARLALKADLEAAGIEVLDPTDAAVAASAEGDVAIKTDQHWSPFGARAVASYVASSLGREGPAPGSLIELQDQRPFTFQGDLASAIGMSEASEAAGVLTEVVRPAFAVFPDGELVDPDWTEAHTVVVGTSASSNPYWGFVSALSFEFQQPVGNMSISGGGPFYPMHLAREEFAAHGHYPERVIWEVTLSSIYNQNHLDAIGPERSIWSQAPRR